MDMDIPRPDDAGFNKGDILEVREGSAWDGTQFRVESFVAYDYPSSGRQWFYHGPIVQHSKRSELGNDTEISWRNNLVLISLKECPSCERKQIAWADYICEECRYGY